MNNDIITILSNNLHLIVGAFALLVYALARLVEARAKANPDKTWEDDWASVAGSVSAQIIGAVEQLAAAKGWKGTEKLAKVLEHTKEIEALWKAGKMTEAIATVNALVFDAEKKAENIHVPAANPTQPPTK